MTNLPLNSVVASVTRKSDSSVYVKGYAIPGATGNIAAVEISTDGGGTWKIARIIYQEGKWSWTLWDADLEGVSSSGLVYSRAIDTHGRVQGREGIWNMRGVGFSGWGVGSW